MKVLNAIKAVVSMALAKANPGNVEPAPVVVATERMGRNAGHVDKRSAAYKLRYRNNL